MRKGGTACVHYIGYILLHFGGKQNVLTNYFLFESRKIIACRSLLKSNIKQSCCYAKYDGFVIIKYCGSWRDLKKML